MLSGKAFGWGAGRWGQGLEDELALQIFSVKVGGRVDRLWKLVKVG